MNVYFENIKKKYEEHTVLDLDKGSIEEGCITAIVGPNGAGKSTLLKIIAGIEKADEGRIFFDDSAHFPQMDVTLVFQNPYLFSTTVEKNIAYPLKLRGFDKSFIEERTAPLMEELNLTALKKKKAWKLSGGETQKVALARALSFKPKLLLLDEPTANIDPYSTAEIEKLLLSTGKKQDTTVVLVTHNLAQAKRICNKVMMLHEGHLIEYGDCRKVLTNPDDIRTRRFIEGELLI